MNAGRSTGRRVGNRRFWLSSALLVLGGTFSLMALVSLGAPAPERSPATTSRPPAASFPSATATLQAASPVAVTLDGQPHQHGVVAGATATPEALPAPTELAGASEDASQDRPPGWSGRGALIAGIEVERARPATLPLVSTPTSVPDMPPATHITIEAVGVNADIVEVSPEMTALDGRSVFTWAVADWAAGHHNTSANPGEGGNVVLSGHDDVRGEVFRGLHDISLGDEVTLTSPAGGFTYIVTEIHLREYRDASNEERIAAGAFLAPMPEERLTLVTCWPYRVDTHRMIVVAKPKVSG